jgi:uncharacterized membrane protein YkvA (DUF1232 family)
MIPAQLLELFEIPVDEGQLLLFVVWRKGAKLTALREQAMARTPLGKRIVGGSLFAGLLSKAAQYAKDPDRLKDLASTARRKAETAGQTGVLKEFWDTLMTFLRLTRAYAKGDYRQVPWETVTLAVAAVLYFLMPLDVIPDVLMGLGFVDDAAVIAWVMNTVGPELGKFRQWEASRGQSASD